MYRTSLITLVFTLCTALAYSQKKISYYNKLTEITGTPYCFATYEETPKKGISGPVVNYLLFINTANGEKTQIDFPKNANLGRVEQLHLDSLNLTRVLVMVWEEWDDKKFIDLRETPHYLTVFSDDGKQQVRLTDEGFFCGHWVVNYVTNTIIIPGYYDLNNNGKHDDTDKSDILIFDLKTLKPIRHE